MSKAAGVLLRCAFLLDACKRVSFRLGKTKLDLNGGVCLFFFFELLTC